jgi:hypothetical protein
MYIYVCIYIYVYMYVYRVLWFKRGTSTQCQSWYEKNTHLHEFYVLRSIIPIKYETFTDYNDIKSNSYCIIVQGNCSPLQLLLTAGIDVCVCGSSGDTPLLIGLGLGTKRVVIGGYTLNFKNSSYTARCSEDETLDVVKSLLAVDALVNACNKRGVVPLHIAAARGHLALIDVLKNSGAIANAEDEGRYLQIYCIYTYI